MMLMNALLAGAEGDIEVSLDCSRMPYRAAVLAVQSHSQGPCIQLKTPYIKRRPVSDEVLGAGDPYQRPVPRRRQ